MSASLPDFRRIETWIFDLDNTLYHPSARLFDQIDARMTAFIARRLKVSREAADRMRHDYWQRYGITLKGLVEHHAIAPGEFLDEVHDIDLAGLAPDPALAARIARLPGRRIVHTNGARAHAERVLRARGLAGAFEAVYGIEDKGLVPKPSREAYDRIRAAARFAPERAAMIEDDARNLAEPKALGMTTVWLRHAGDAPPPAHVDRTIGCLAGFLDEIA
jgi:putative hydrolase of the HAD superfamily